MNDNIHLYSARVVSVYDADTFTLIVSIDDFNLRVKVKIRLLGIDCPEIRTKNSKEKALSIEARDYVRELILNKDILVDIVGTGKYGRSLANIYYKGINLADELIKKKYGREYFGGKRLPWFSDESI